MFIDTVQVIINYWWISSDGPSPATDSLTIQFDPGFYDIIIFTNNFECFDSETLNICVEEYDFDLNELNIEIPDTVGKCSNYNRKWYRWIDFSCISTIDDWFEGISVKLNDLYIWWSGFFT